MRRLALVLTLLVAATVTPSAMRASAGSSVWYRVGPKSLTSPKRIEVTRWQTRSDAASFRVLNATDGRARCVLSETLEGIGLIQEGSYAGKLLARAHKHRVLAVRLTERVGERVVGRSVSRTRLAQSWRGAATTYVPRRPGESTLEIAVFTVTPVARGTCFSFARPGIKFKPPKTGPGGNPSPSPSDPPTPLPEPGILTQDEALARPTVIVPPNGILTVGSPAADTTYDLRAWSFSGDINDRASDYPISLGKSHAASGLVTVGGSVTQNIPVNMSWDDYYHTSLDGNGSCAYVFVADWSATYNLECRDVWDGYRPRVQDGTENSNTATWLLADAYMRGVHDDVVENDDLMSGTVRNSLVDDTFVGFSERGSTNPGSTLTLRGVIMRLGVYSYGDKLGTGKVFKWSDAGGKVDAANCIFLLDANTNQSQSSQVFPAGTYSNVTVILGPGFVGDYPVPLPPGVTVTRDVSIYTDARDAWLTAHGLPL